jgi:hypothetical protein
MPALPILVACPPLAAVARLPEAANSAGFKDTHEISPWNWRAK